MSEDIITLCVKLLNVAKRKDEVKNVTSRNGKIICFMTNDTRVVLDSPDDLFKIGYNDIDYKALGLAELD